MKSIILKLKSFFGEPKRTDSKNIYIEKNVFISKTAVVEIRYGGSIHIQDNTEIMDGALILSYGGDIKIGMNSSINAYTVIYGHGSTVIGNNVLIAGHCMIIPNNHTFISKDINIRDQGSTAKGIIIDDDVWIGHGCSILDGVTIGKGSVIAAGSVVNKSIEPYSVFAGVPAVKIKNR